MQLVQRQNLEEAFNLALGSEDEMLLIRLLSKTGCNLSSLSQLICVAFEFNKVSIPLREDILKKALILIEGNEFIDILLPCIAEVVDKHSYLWPVKLARSMAERMG